MAKQRKQSQPKISVVIAIYKMEDYLEQCLKNVISQTLKDIEVICINDGSPDNCGAILKDYSQIDSRIKVFEQENRGFAETRNRGIREANGKYIAFLDPDDWYPSDDILEALYKAATTNHALICGGCFSEFNEKTQQYKDEYKGILEDYTFKEEGFISYSDYQFDYGPHRFIYDTTFLKNNNLFYPNRARFQDTTFFIKALDKAEKFYAISKIVYCYRIGHQEMIWNEKKATDLVYGIIENLEFSLEKSYAKLHYLTAHRLFIDFYDRVLPNCTEENLKIKEAINKVISLVDISLMKQYKTSDIMYLTYKYAFYPFDSLNHDNYIKITSEKGSSYYTDSVEGIEANFLGQNARIELFEPIPKFCNCRFDLGDNTIIRIGPSNYHIRSLTVLGSAPYSQLLIGKNFSCNGGSFALCDESRLKIVIGDNCMFSINIRIRTSDGHTIINKQNNVVINEGKDVVIGNNVWLGSTVSILKGAIIPDGCIVGTNSTVSGIFNEKDCIIAGIPGRVIKHSIKWNRLNTEAYLQKQYDFSINNNSNLILPYDGPYVSIVVPIYNIEKYLRECLDSIINQTLQNIEIICVNDGSKDNSLSIIEEYQQKDPRIKLVSHENHGYGYSMNAGFKVAQGKYIGIVEPDDYIDVRMFERLFVAAEKYNTECVKSDFYTFIGDGEERVIEKKSLSTLYPDLYYKRISPRYETRAFSFIKNNWTGIYRRDFIEKANISHNETPGASYQDNGFWFQCFCRLNSLVFIKEAFYYYRQDNPNSSINNERNAFIIYNEWEFIKRKCSKNLEMFPALRDIYLRQKLNSLIWHYNRINASFKPKFKQLFTKYIVELVYSNLLRSPIFTDYELKLIENITGKSIKSFNKENKEKDTQLHEAIRLPLKQKIKNFIKKLPGFRMLAKRFALLYGKIDQNESELAKLRETINYQAKLINQLQSKINR